MQPTSQDPIQTPPQIQSFPPSAPPYQAPPVQQAPVAAPAQLQTAVQYMTNVTIFGAKPALLEWTADNRIRLFEMNSTTNQAVRVIFDAALSDIQKIGGNMSMLSFYIAGVKYPLLFSNAAIPLMAGGVVGLALSMRATKKSGITIWTQKLKQYSVKTSVYGWNWSLIAGGIIGVIIVIIVVIAVIAQQ